MKHVISSLTLAVCLTISPLAVASPSGIVVAQSLDIDIGGGPGRVYRDDGYRDRPRYEERERFRERRWDGERDYERPRVQRFYEPRRICRLVTIRRETPYGVRIQRIRRCY